MELCPVRRHGRRSEFDASTAEVTTARAMNKKKRDERGGHSRTLAHESEPSPSAGYLTRARWATVPVRSCAAAGTRPRTESRILRAGAAALRCHGRLKPAGTRLRDRRSRLLYEGTGTAGRFGAYCVRRARTRNG